MGRKLRIQSFNTPYTLTFKKMIKIIEQFILKALNRKNMIKTNTRYKYSISRTIVTENHQEIYLFIEPTR